MRATTHTHIAFRNIGDSQDAGSFHEGTVSECILWLATKISQTSMATRFVFGMGRTQSEAGLAIEVSGAGKNLLTGNMKSMLDAVFNDPAVAKDYLDSQPKIEGDDYVA